NKFAGGVGIIVFPPRKDTRKDTCAWVNAFLRMATTTNCSKLARSSSIIVLLVAVALAPIVTAGSSGAQPVGRSAGHVVGSPGAQPVGRSAGHDPHSHPCIPCSHFDACPYCHGGVKNVYG
ncbi:unnamed protein product, partial [Urochloa humidicola]